MKQLDILIVDDSKSVLYAMDKTLRPIVGCIHTASNALDAQQIISDVHLDLVITDVDMPGMDGLELCSWIKNNPLTSHLPVIILSSRESDKDIDMGFKVGADAYVPKSTAAQTIVEKIKQVLDMVAMSRDRLILVVDDSQAVRTIMNEGLTKAGFRVELAGNGQEGLEKLEKVTPDLILADLIMPELNGVDMCREILGRPEFADIPVVVMSCVSDESLMHRMIQEGVTAYVTKPIGVNNLIQVLKRILSEQFHLMMLEQKRLLTERKLTLGSITSLVRALEVRDRYTCGHSESVAGIALGIAQQLGVDDVDMTRLHIAGLLHDLGKIGIRDNVLLKPASLTSDEFEHIKTHTTMVADILNPLPGMEEILIAASSHHERWDGSGYPRGLKGEEIPFLGRIIAVADVFDAMTSDRIYRKRKSPEFALKTIADGKGKLFCPQCVDAFFEWHGEFSGKGKKPAPGSA